MSLIWFNGRIREEIYSGIKYDEFIEKLTSKLRDRESRRVNERTYESFIEDLWYIIKVATQIGEQTLDEDLQRLIKNDVYIGNDIPYDELNVIMIKDISLK